MNVEAISNKEFLISNLWKKTITIFGGTLFLSFLLFKVVGVNFEETSIIEFHNSEVFWYIIFNNTKVYLVIFLGLFLFKIPTYVTLIYNAVILGFAFSAINNFKMLFSILAHGLFEISAFIIAAYIAFNKLDYVLKNKKIFSILFGTGIVLLIIAAMIETYISPIIIRS